MPSRYRRHPAGPIPADAFKLLSRLAEERGVDLQHTVQVANAHSVIESILEQARAPIRLYGKRAEEMFAYVVVALGIARAVKREETDDLIVAETDDVAVPDFRLVFHDRSEIFVEVKNINERVPTKSRSPKLRYLKRLSAYGDLFNRPVYLAAYWSRWRTWTLHPVDELVAALNVGPISFSFGEAYRRSHMQLLGDALVGTEYPLALKMEVTSRVLSKNHSTSKQLMTIDSAELYVAGKRVKAKRDERIAFGFMFYGGWEESENLTMDGDRVAAIEYSFSPAAQQLDQPFAPVASLSSLASSEFIALTADAGSVRKLRPQQLPAPPYPYVGEKYYGQDLPLWMFILKPARPWHEDHMPAV